DASSVDSFSDDDGRTAAATGSKSARGRIGELMIGRASDGFSFSMVDSDLVMAASVVVLSFTDVDDWSLGDSGGVVLLPLTAFSDSSAVSAREVSSLAS